MNTLRLLPPPGPPQSARGLSIALTANVALVLALNLLGRVDTMGSAAVRLVFFSAIHRLLSCCSCWVPLGAGSHGWGTGFLLWGLFVLLVGVSMSGQQL